MSMLKNPAPTAKDYKKTGMTKQSFKDETDINIILKRAQKSGTISHLSKYEARYGDFSGFDFSEAQIKIAQGGEIFDALPVELKREFNQSSAQFFDYVNNPENKDRLAELLPDLALPGTQMVRVSSVVTADETDPEPDPEPEPESAPAAPEPPVQPTT